MPNSHASDPACRWRRHLCCSAVALVAAVLLATSTADQAQASELRRTAIVRAIETARPSVVNIQGEKALSPYDAATGAAEASQRVSGMGTGVIIDPRGYIITNHHVIDGVQRVLVTLHDGSSYTARTVSYDATTDLAVIQIDAGKKLPVIRIGTSSDLLPGEEVLAVGNAFGYEHTVTRGIISALNRSVQVGESQAYEDLIQTDASINPGNSGGPLLNIDGEMIGINVAVRVGAQGIGFAIPVDTALEVAADLLSVSRVDGLWHGLVLRSETGADTGLVVERVEPNSPAAAAGIKTGDRITTTDGKPIARPLDFERALLGHRAGDAVPFSARRGDQPLNLQLELARAPAGGGTKDDPIWNVLGLRLKPVATGQFQRYRSKYRGGLAVTAVRTGSPAARQGIRRGDVLVGMHVWETVTEDNVQYILNRPDFASFEPIKFYILRGSETLYGHMTVSTHP